jgi:hypothetical protein
MPDIVARDRLFDAMPGMAAQDLSFHAVQGCLNCRDLIDHVDAVTIGPERVRDAAHLPFDLAEPLQTRLLGLGIHAPTMHLPGIKPQAAGLRPGALPRRPRGPNRRCPRLFDRDYCQEVEVRSPR